jgi:RNA polymerase sigma factor (sigma-70 family)
MNPPLAQQSAKSTPSDAALLSLIEGGDWAALGALFDVHGAAVRRFIRNSGVPASEVDDLVQQTFLDVPSASRRFDNRFSGRRWLLGIAAVIVARQRRSWGRQAAREAAWASDPALRPPQNDTCSELEWRQGAKRALGALGRLTSKKREVFEMIVLEDISGVEAARTLGVPVATVWTRMHHARRDLRRLLKLLNAGTRAAHERPNTLQGSPRFSSALQELG